MYHKEEKNELDPQTVFTAKNSDISQTAVTQCKYHTWEALNNSEIICRKCQTVAIVGENNIYKYV